jgi:hypothetical protein
MTLSNPFTKIYTNPVQPHSNLVIGTIQIVFWLFFHPSAWSHFISTINPNLRSDFYLAELTKKDLKNPIFKKFCVQIYILLPIILIILVSLIKIPLNTLFQGFPLGPREFTVQFIRSVFSYGTTIFSISFFLSVSAGIVFVTAYMVILSIMLLICLIVGIGFTIPVGFSVYIAGLFAIGAMGSIAIRTTLQHPLETQKFKIVKLIRTTLMTPLVILLFLVITYGIGMLIFYVTNTIIGAIQGNLTETIDATNFFFNNLENQFHTSEGMILLLVCFVFFCMMMGFLYKYVFQWRRETGLLIDKDEILRLSYLVPSTIAIVGFLTLRYPISVPVIGAIFGLIGSIVLGRVRRDWEYTALSIFCLVLIAWIGGYIFLNFFSNVLGGFFICIFYIRSERFAGAWAGGLTMVLGLVGLGALSMASELKPDDTYKVFLSLLLLMPILGLTFNWWLSVLLYPLFSLWNNLLYQFDVRNSNHPKSALRYHSAFWDELQYLPLFGLDKHIILIAQSNLEEAEAAINYLSKTRQRWAAKAAQNEIDARYNRLQ